MGPKKGDNLHARYIGNFISIRVTQIMHKLNLPANLATALMFLFGITGCLIISHSEVSALIGAIFIWIATILDQVDGQLARIYG